MSSQQHVTKAAGVVSFATVITRVLGYLRDMVIATAFGAGMEAVYWNFILMMLGVPLYVWRTRTLVAAPVPAPD